VVFVKTAPVSFANLIKSWRGRGPGGEKSSGVARDVNALRCGHLCRGFIDDPLDLRASILSGGIVRLVTYYIMASEGLQRAHSKY
ncbi:unnamed protein product, partial [Tenebrio molitor]